MNPRVLADTGLAILRLARLGYLRSGHKMVRTFLNVFLPAHNAGNEGGR